VLKGNAEPLAKIAPTSLVFGVWDSRDTQAKLPRLVASTIRAFNVRKLMRSAQFVPATEFVENGLLPEAPDKKTADAYAERGFIHVPASGSHGGVQLTPQGSIRRDATLSLAALRRLTIAEADGAESERTLMLRRYILGLSLVALTAEQDTYLRQGCNLVPAEEGKSRKFEIVHATGKREPCELKHEDATAYAAAAAESFGVGPDRKVAFDKKRAAKDVHGDAEKLKGEVSSVDPAQKKFTLKTGKGGDQKESEVSTNDSTEYIKAKEPSTFDDIVKNGAKLDVELAAGVATKVSSKK
jgi:CRISPR-associated protein Csb1